MSDPKEPTVISMIYDELRHQGDKLDDIAQDVAVIKDKQVSMDTRLEKLESRPVLDIDKKTLIVIASVLSMAIAGASRGLPEGVWKALIGLLAG